MWYRMDCGVGLDELWEELGSHAGVPGMLMLGHYTAFTGVYAERLIRGKITGSLADLQDATIEKWATWSGAPGTFALALRALCTDADSGELRGFRIRNEHILRKQLLDAKKPSAQQRKRQAGADPVIDPAEHPPREGLGDPPGEGLGDPPGEKVKFPRVYDDGNSDGSEASSAAGARDRHAEITDRLAYVQRCTAACNRGLRENPQVGARLSELVTSNQIEVAGQWYDDGIPPELTEGAIYARALEYKPAGHNLQPRSLSYFRDTVKEARERESSRAQEQALDTKLRPSRSGARAEEEDEFVRAGRELDERRAREKATAHV
jgi:hypothetical protein